MYTPSFVKISQRVTEKNRWECKSWRTDDDGYPPWTLQLRWPLVTAELKNLNNLTGCLSLMPKISEYLWNFKYFLNISWLVCHSFVLNTKAVWLIIHWGLTTPWLCNFRPLILLKTCQNDNFPPTKSQFNSCVLYLWEKLNMMFDIKISMKRNVRRAYIFSSIMTSQLSCFLNGALDGWK